MYRNVCFYLISWISNAFPPSTLEKHLWWGEWKVRLGTPPAFPPWLSSVAFFRKVSLKLPCTSFHHHPCKFTHRVPFVRLRQGQSTEKLCQAKQVDSCAKIPQLRSQIKLENDQLLLVENSTETLHRVPVPSAHTVPSACTIVYMCKLTCLVVHERRVASRCLCHLTAGGFLHIFCVNISRLLKCRSPQSLTRLGAGWGVLGF